MSNVVDMLGKPIAERAADRVIPPVRQPVTLEEFSDVGELQVSRDRATNTLGTWLAVGVGVAAFFLVRDWRAKRKKQ